MPDKEKNNDTATKKAEKNTEAKQVISEDERFHYIGFEVFPGKPKDLFESEEEKKKWVESVIERRKKGAALIREECTLCEERVTLIDKIVLSIACVVIFASLFMPWFAVYNEIEETATISETPADSAMVAATTADSLNDSLAAIMDSAVDTAAAVAQQETAPVDTAAMAATEAGGEKASVTSEKRGVTEEIIHGYVAKKKFYKEYDRVSAIGAIISIGSLGSYVFSSGFALLLTVIVFMIYIILCIALPIYTLFGLYGGKGDPDEQVLKLKKILRYNWIPLILFVIALVLSFFGGDYSFDAASMYTSLGDGYNVGVFLDSLSWGVIVSLAAFILVAAKGSEI